jgi:regulatory protein
MAESLPFKEILRKLEYYCSYQERCHFEVEQKLYSLEHSADIRNQIIVKLIEDNFLNEERFASLYAQSKLHQKKWGKVRIKLELKARKISDYLINKSLNELSEEEYSKTFETLAEKHWESSTIKNKMKKRKHFCDYMLRNGWESELVYEKVKELEKSSD